MLIYALLGTSNYLSVGPVAVTSIILMTGISVLAEPFSEDFINLLLITGLITGVIQVLLGIFRMGFLTNLISQPVISGFISAAAIIIIISQISNSLGIQIPRKLSAIEAIGYTFQHIKSTHLITFSITAFAITFLLVFRKINKKLPAALLLIMLFIGLSYFLDLKSYGVTIIGTIPSGFPEFAIPNFNFETIKKLIPTATTLTLIGYIGSVGIGKSFEMKYRNYKVLPNRELIALGFAKIAGTFFQGNLVSGSYSRSAINEDAGAKTLLSSVVVAIIIVFSLLYLTPLLYYLPKAVLAAIILVSVLSLIKTKEAIQYFNIRLDDFLVMLVTFLVSLVFTISTGILVGTLLSFAIFQYKSANPHVAELVKLPNTNYYRNINRFPEGEQVNDYSILRFDDQLYFGNASYFKEVIFAHIDKKEPKPKFIILHANNIHNIDSSGIYALEDIQEELTKKEITILFSGLIGPVRDILIRADFFSKDHASKQFMNISDAVNYANTQQDNNPETSSLITQHNDRRFISFRKRKR